MITLLMGENSFEKERMRQKIEASVRVTSEVFEGASLELKQLPDLLMGMTLFASERLVIIKNASDNKTIWDELPVWVGRKSPDTHLLLIETKPDQRTRTFKDLQKTATVHKFEEWTERDAHKAESWVADEATKLHIALDKKCIHHLVARVGAQQWILFQALQKLAILSEVTTAVIDKITEPSPSENIFNLFEAALKGNGQRVHSMVKTLSLSEDPYRLFGLLSNQVVQLFALSISEKDTSAIAKDIGAHPFAVSKLALHAARLGQKGTGKIAHYFVEADDAMKSSMGEPWLLIERALIKTSQVKV